MTRTHTCGQLRLAHTDMKVVLCGWVHNIRDKGKLLWIDLRDRYGVTQIILQEHVSASALFTQARQLSREVVVKIQGVVVARQAKNNALPTGDIEVQAQDIVVLNPAKLPPFLIEEVTDGGEELRMKYRYLDLRRPPLQRNLLLRHQVNQVVRAYLNSHNFVELETPILTKSTPEGARDFLVPSRVHAGHFYALPQSPQTFKQLLMVAGMDRYYQLARCFRDEDLRADRQPEFTQLDCELSFVGQEDILNIFEGLIIHLFKEVKGITLPVFERMTYDQAIQQYGTDKPDLRWDMPLIEFPEVMPTSSLGLTLGINVSGRAISRKQLDQLQEFVHKHHPLVGELMWVKLVDNEVKSSVSKRYSAATLHQLVTQAGTATGDTLVWLSGEAKHVRAALGAVRLLIAQQIGRTPNAPFRPLWVTDFPLLEWSQEEERYVSVHHPFTAPVPGSEALLATHPEKVKSQAYDLVINGIEVGGGSIRIHQRALQEAIFDCLKISKAEATKKFGFLLTAFEYGAPPHGGLAFGMDRLCMILDGGETIRDYIPFPKNNAARDVMLDTPSLLAPEDTKQTEPL